MQASSTNQYSDQTLDSVDLGCTSVGSRLYSPILQAQTGDRVVKPDNHRLRISGGIPHAIGFGIVPGLLLLSLACSMPQILSGDGQVVPATSSEPEGLVGGTTTQGIEQIIQATVQVFAMVRDGTDWSPVWSGSGSLISADGLVLTNNHVVDETVYDFDALGIALTTRSDQPPKLEYLAEVVAQDPRLDFAVVKIVSDLAGNSVSVEFAYVVPGNSDEVEIGDELRILGYPGIGGETITLTEGAVSGFTLERGVDGRAWIKTDATIAGGNSGGLGANSEGELVGIPTIVTSGSEYGQSVDCRPLADTDRDGDIDSADSCVPVGGFINALRPINLAAPLIEAAVAGRQYLGSEPQMPPEGFDIGQVKFEGLLFSDGVTETNEPTQLWYALPDTSTTICAFWDYQGMTDGLTWSSYWFINGELDEGSSISGQVWGGGEQGNWWVCNFNENGLANGVYEVVLEVEGSVLATDSVFVGGSRNAINYMLVNSSEAAVCLVNLSPTDANNWGQNDLASGERIEPGGSRGFPLASGTYDLRVVDCSGNPIVEEFGLEIDANSQYRIEK